MITPYPIKSPRKLIEVSLPLDSINTESIRRKQKAPKGWPTSFHKWWAQRPIAAARAVIFAQLVNDPGYQQGRGFKYGKNKKDASVERKRLFKIIEELIKWENSANPEVLERALTEIRKSWNEVCELNKDHPQAKELFNPESLPAIYDPFAGSGTIPLEAQRLGLRAIASDLNPVAVLINKALMEFPRKFSGRPPVRPAQLSTSASGDLGLRRRWLGATGLAEDVRFYGEWMREEAHKRIGHLYPEIETTNEITSERPDLEFPVGTKLTPIAWIWARTVKSPNPVFRHVHVPLISNFVLSSKAEGAYVEPVVIGDHYAFKVKVGVPPPGASKGTKLARANFRCLLSGTPIESDFIKAEGQAGRMNARLMAMVVEYKGKRLYLSPTAEQEEIARRARPEWKPELAISGSTQYVGVKPYGMETFSQLFTDRQLTALTAFSDLSQEVLQRCREDAVLAGMSDDPLGIESGGSGAIAYAEAVSTYLALVVDRMVFYGSSLCGWLTKDNAMGKSMPQQAFMMTWDFAEGNPLGKSSADIGTCIKSVSNYLELAAPNADVSIHQHDVRVFVGNGSKVILSTDPPYYDNVPYADLSDFFYVWLRRSLKPIFPDLFATIASPKEEELVAFAYRHETGKAGAEEFFLKGMTDAMHRLAEKAHPAFPSTIYYAFKQTETDENAAISSTGWVTFLEAVIRAGFAISGTWPMRTESERRMRAADSNALASSIILVCRKRSVDAAIVSRRDFLRELNTVLPEALDEMTRGSGEERSPVDPVDLSQAILGPGMAAFSKYAAVLEADGKPMSVRTALQLINRFLAEDDFDPDTQFCLHWFEQHGWGQGRFGDADTLSRAKGTSVDGVRDAGVIESGGGVVRLRKWSEYPSDWNPQKDMRLPVWEVLHQFIRALRNEGETTAGHLLASVREKSEATRQLAYRLHTLCERQGWAEDARAYNELITSWTGIEVAASMVPTEKTQGSLFE
jgi:putative DNA methylase